MSRWKQLVGYNKDNFLKTDFIFSQIQEESIEIV